MLDTEYWLERNGNPAIARILDAGWNGNPSFAGLLITDYLNFFIQ